MSNIRCSPFVRAGITNRHKWYKICTEVKFKWHILQLDLLLNKPQTCDWADIFTWQTQVSPITFKMAAVQFCVLDKDPVYCTLRLAGLVCWHTYVNGIDTSLVLFVTAVLFLLWQFNMYIARPFNTNFPWHWTRHHSTKEILRTVNTTLHNGPI